MAPKSAKPVSISDSALVNEEMLYSENDHPVDDTPYWAAKGRGKGHDKNKSAMTCERCGHPGRPARDCKIAWDRIVAKRTASPEVCGAFIALCPDCGHPDCEGPNSDSDSDNSTTLSDRSTADFNF